jgi:hypothetical protein
LSDIEFIKNGIVGMLNVSSLGGEIHVHTHCLYPSNNGVSVVVRGGGDSYVVSDNGGALSEIRGAGIGSRPTDRQVRAIVAQQGLKVRDGVIYAPPVSLEAVPAAIVIVANAAKEMADWGLDHMRFSVPRNFRADLAALLERRFHDNMKVDQPIIGASNKPHKFGHVIYLPRDRKVLVDPVVNDASSINARVVANLDVKMLNDPKTKQVIVYDDRLKWTASDLNLLRVGAPIVPFSGADQEIDRLAA